ncbi:hypothetical protein IGS68_34950 (plasmid) [Skermanella sp. TT6]|uniref:Uncharacterized protein n=1 Tax=Skermanella cutis TaxID=2775420 RepID=A0ABX7BNP7_9PROT|nr:hypothetical protein [Skermanella sp. TT6]QQP93978.1 hypothetical protein IGS68_34950 [Skermanella sp. TT6]
MVLVLLWERQPLASIGWHGFGSGSFAWGLALSALLMWVLHSVLARILDSLCLGGFDDGRQDLLANIIIAHAVTDTDTVGLLVLRPGWPR